MQVEHLTNPSGIDILLPRFSWKIMDDTPGARQLSYRLLVDDDSVRLHHDQSKKLWDSGKISSNKQLISYSGPRLRPYTKYFWKVMATDQEGKNYALLENATFETGHQTIENWQGTWISDHADQDVKQAPYFRKSWSLKKKIKSARAYIAVAGLYELYINGVKIGNHRLDPMYTRFDRRNIYVTHDVTSSFVEGENVMGVLLGNGWYNHQSVAVWDFHKAPWRNRPAFCMDVHIRYEDGSLEVVSTDQAWKTSYSPIVFNSIYTGEHYDGRLEQSGWNKPGFDDQKWNGVKLRAAPSSQIVSQTLYPIRNVEQIKAEAVHRLNDSTYVYDFGRNIAGVTEIRIKGQVGTVLRLKHGERLSADGHVDLSNIDVYHKPVDLRDPFQTDVFILSGQGEESFMPRFNYKGFQYVEIQSSTPIALSQKEVTAFFMHSDVPAIGHLTSSSNLLNKIWWATNNSYLSNLFGYPTDCPQREKNGWTGDGHFAIETGLYNFDGITIYEKWMADHRDEQQPNGVLPDIIPTGGWGDGTANGTDWTSTIAIIPWNLYLFYGDSRPLADNYESIKKYVDYVTRISPNRLTTWGRGDWVPVKSSSSLELTSSIYYYVDASILAKAAKLLNKDADHHYYSRLADEIKEAINHKYLNTQTASYATGTQTELSVPLLWGVVPTPLRARVAANLAARVKQDGNHLDVGVLGAKAILNALSENGYPALAYQLATNDTYPSWGWWIVNGATTLYENWDLNAQRDISENHMMFGEIGAWLTKSLGGIKADEEQPGFAHFYIEPHLDNDLKNFKNTFIGPYGPIEISWKQEAKRASISIRIPPNSTATYTLSSQKWKKAYVNGQDTYGKAVTLASGIHEVNLR